MIESDLANLIRLHKDKERLRIAYDIIESLESLNLYRGDAVKNVLVSIIELSRKVRSEMSYLEEKEEDG